MDEYDAEARLMREFGLTDNQAKFVILVTSGKRPFDACNEAYSYTSDKNVYAQLRSLHKNPKIEKALKAFGRSLKDEQQKAAIPIIQAWTEIAFSPTTTTRDRLAALDKLAMYNPELQTMKRKDADDREEAEIVQRVQEWLKEESDTGPEDES